MPIELTPVASSNLSQVGYDENTQTLRIQFLDGSVYDYTGVPIFIYEGLMTAASKGSFLNRNVKGQYPYQKIQ